MKYTKIKFIGETFEYTEVDHLNSYTKNNLYASLGSHHMYVDTDKLEIGEEKFKKQLLKYYNNLINKIENDFRTN